MGFFYFKSVYVESVKPLVCMLQVERAVWDETAQKNMPLMNYLKSQGLSRHWEMQI